MLMELGPREAFLWPLVDVIGREAAAQRPGLHGPEQSLWVGEKVQQWADNYDKMRKNEVTGSEIMALFARVAKVMHGGGDAPETP